MKRLLIALSIFGGLFLGSFALATAAGCTPFLVASGGTGNCAFQSGYLLFGNGTSAIATSTNLFWNNIANRLSFTYGSTTALSATTLCLSTDCRTTWPSGGGSSFGQSWEIFGTGANSYLAPTTTIGIIVSASSTIGNGLGGGLTINDSATTTGNMNILGGFNVGSTTPAFPIAFSLNSNGPGSNAQMHYSFAISSTTATGAMNDLFVIDGRGQVGVGVNAVTSSGMALNIIGNALASGGFTATTFTISGGAAASFIGGTAATSQARLKSTTGSGTTDSIVFQLGTNGASEGGRFQDNSGVVNFGVGTTSPFAKFSIFATSTDTNTTLFAIGSSTPAGATTTLFSISNIGSIFTQLSNGCIQASSGLLTSTGSNCNTASLTGTAGQVAYFSGTNTAVGTSSIFINSATGNVMIGTTTPISNSILTIGRGTPTGTTTVMINGGAGGTGAGALLLFGQAANSVTTFVTGGIGNSSSYFNNAFDINLGLISQTAISFFTNANSTPKATLDTTGFFGLATTTPYAQFSVATGTILVAEFKPAATSTSQQVNWLNGTQQLLQLGTSGVTITFINQAVGQTLRLVTCAPASGTMGTITWPAGIRWAGGTTPTQTTTAQKCDIYSFIDTQATSTTAKADTILGAQTASF